MDQSNSPVIKIKSQEISVQEASNKEQTHYAKTDKIG